MEKQNVPTIDVEREWCVVKLKKKKYKMNFFLSENIK